MKHKFSPRYLEDIIYTLEHKRYSSLVKYNYCARIILYTTTWITL